MVKLSGVNSRYFTRFQITSLVKSVISVLSDTHLDSNEENVMSNVQTEVYVKFLVTLRILVNNIGTDQLLEGLDLFTLLQLSFACHVYILCAVNGIDAQKKLLIPNSHISFCCDLLLLLLNRLTESSIPEYIEIIVSHVHKSFIALISLERNGRFQGFSCRLICNICSRFLKLLRHQFIVDESNRKYQRYTIEKLLPIICSYLTSNDCDVALVREIRLLLCYGLFTSNTVSEIIGINIMNKYEVADSKVQHNMRRTTNAESIRDVIVTFFLDESFGADKTSAVINFVIHCLMFSLITVENDLKPSGASTSIQLLSVPSKLLLWRIMPFVCSLTSKLRQQANLVIHRYFSIIDSILSAIFDCFRGSHLQSWSLSAECARELSAIKNYVVHECVTISSAIKSILVMDEAVLTDFYNNQQLLHLRDSILYTISNILNEDMLKDLHQVVAKYLSLDQHFYDMEWKSIDFIEMNWSVDLGKILELATNSNVFMTSFTVKQFLNDSMNTSYSKQCSCSLLRALLLYTGGKVSMFIKIWKYASELRAINELVITMNSVWSQSSSLMHPILYFILYSSHVESSLVSSLLSIPYGQFQSLENSFISSIEEVDFQNWGKLWFPTIACKLNERFERTSLEIKSYTNESSRRSLVMEKLSTKLLFATKELLFSLFTKLSSNAHQSCVISAVRRVIAFLSSAIYLLANAFQESRLETKKIICMNIAESCRIIFQASVSLLSLDVKNMLLQLKLLLLQFSVDTINHTELTSLHADNIFQFGASDFNDSHSCKDLSHLKSFCMAFDISISDYSSIVEKNCKICFHDVFLQLQLITNANLQKRRTEVYFGTKLWTTSTAHIFQATADSIRDFHQRLLDSSSNVPCDAICFYSLISQLFSIHLLKQLGLEFALEILEKIECFVLSYGREDEFPMFESAVSLAATAILHQSFSEQRVFDTTLLSRICKSILRIRSTMQKNNVDVEVNFQRHKTKCLLHLEMLVANIFGSFPGAKSIMDLLLQFNLSVQEQTDLIFILHKRLQYKAGKVAGNTFRNHTSAFTDAYRTLILHNSESDVQFTNGVLSTKSFLHDLADLNGKSSTVRRMKRAISNRTYHSTSTFLLWCSHCVEQYHQLHSTAKFEFLIHFKLFILLLKFSLVDLYGESESSTGQHFPVIESQLVDEFFMVGNLSFSFVLLKNYLVGTTDFPNIVRNLRNFIPKLKLDEFLTALSAKSSDTLFQYVLEFGMKVLEFSLELSGVFDLSRCLSCLDSLEKLYPTQNYNKVSSKITSAMSALKYSSCITSVALNQFELNLDEFHGTFVLPHLKKLCKKFESFISQVKRMHILSKKLPIVLKIFLRIHGIVTNIHNSGILGESECKQCFQYLGRMLSLFSVNHFKKCSQYMIIGVMKDMSIRKSNLFYYLQGILSASGNHANNIRYSVYTALEKLQSHEKEYMLKLLDSVERLILTELNEEMQRNFKFEGN